MSIAGRHLKLALAALLLCLAFGLQLGPGRAAALTPATTLVMGHCNPPIPGKQWLYPCQSETMTQTVYYDIWEPAGSGDVQLKVNYNCETGYEGFTLSGFLGSTITGGPTDFSNVCNGRDAGENINYGVPPPGVGVPNSDIITVHPPGGVGCANAFGVSECEMIIKATAVDPPQGPPEHTDAGPPSRPSGSCGNSSYCYFYGGLIATTLSYSSGGGGPQNVDVLPGVRQISTLDPAAGQPDALKPGGGWASGANQFGQQNGNGYNPVSYTFKVPCNYNSGKAYIGYENINWADKNVSPTGTVTMTLTNDRTGNTPIALSNGGIGANPQPDYPNPFWGGSEDNYWTAARDDLNTVHSVGFNPVAGDTYTLTLQGISGGDTIFYSLPFPSNSADLGLRCWQLNGTSAVKNITTGTGYANRQTAHRGDVVKFRQTVTNGGNDGMNVSCTPTLLSATPSLNGNPGSPGSQSGLKAGASKSFYTSFTIPNSAPNNQKYCQYVSYKPASSTDPSSGDDGTATACVTVIVSSTAPPCGGTGPAKCIATCSISSTNGIVGPLPGGYVEAGKNFTVNATITNLSPTNSLPLTFGGQTLRFASYPYGPVSSYTFNQSQAGNPNFPLFPNGQPGDSITISFTAGPAPAGNPSTTTVVGAPEYAGPFTGDPLYSQRYCSATVNAYQPFSFQVTSQAALTPTNEDPSGWTYATSVINNGSTTVPVSIPTYSSVYSNTAAAGTNYIGTYNGSYNAGPFGSGTTKVVPPGSAGSYPPTAGDTYCADISTPGNVKGSNNAGSYVGYVGPGGSTDVVDESGSSASSSCPAVVNKPFFKVYGSGISAGGDFAPTCSGGGELASWNNDSGTYDYGASGQLSALAVLGITGVASAQTVLARTQTDLTFANSSLPAGHAITANVESPSLGGEFGLPTGGLCLPAVAKGPKPMAEPPGTTSMTPPTTTGSYTVGTFGHPANLVLHGGTIPVGQNVSLFVIGDVYIDGPITYLGDSGGPGGPNVGWSSPDHVPSFVLHAYGKIYIDPGVSELDGLYEAQRSHSTIYTCGDPASATSPPFKAMAKDSLFNGCRNQLTIYGSFVADHVNLMRTYGSLRDEKPSFTWSYTGPIAGMNCTLINEAGTPSFNNTNHYLCVPPSFASAGYSLNWSYAGSTGGLPYCTTFYDPSWASDPQAYGWRDNLLCTNDPNLNASFHAAASYNPGNDPGSLCIRIDEPTDPNPVAKWSTGNYLCQPRPTCSNTPAGFVSTEPQTCAAEVFHNNGELPVSQPTLSSSCGGQTCYSNFTSLPPVL